MRIIDETAEVGSLTNEATAEEKTDFFDSSYGLLNGEWRSQRRRIAMDILFQARLLLNWSYLTLRFRARKSPVRKILIVGVEVPSRANDLRTVFRRLSESHHDVSTIAAPMIDGKGKFENVNAALKSTAVDDYDWLIVVDDDISLPAGFLDSFTYLAERTDLQIAMPAHRVHSYQTFEVTARRWNSLVRVTRFVESGPLTAFSRQAFRHLLPFPALRWAWGTDVAWSEMAIRQGFRIGVVDATPLRHLRPIAASYSSELAKDEARAFLEESGVTMKRCAILQTVERIAAV